MKKPDRIYQEVRSSVEPFTFNSEVADAFDDMLHRSIPFYQSIQEAVAELVKTHYTSQGTIYDLGCSTGNTIYAIARLLDSDNLKVTGMDSSEAMVRKCLDKLAQFKLKGRIEIIKHDIRDAVLREAEIVLLSFTLQFVKPEQKQSVVSRIYKNLPKGGSLILSDKVTQSDPVSNDLFSDTYHRYKISRGYTELEISQKRDALENVLTPVTLNQLKVLLKQAGFTRIDCFFKWFNFASLLAIK